MKERKERLKVFWALILTAVIVIGTPGMNVLAATYAYTDVPNASVIHSGDVITFTGSNQYAETHLNIFDSSAATPTLLSGSQVFSANSPGSVTIANGDWVYDYMTYSYSVSGGVQIGGGSGGGSTVQVLTINMYLTPYSSGSTSSSSGSTISSTGSPSSSVNISVEDYYDRLKVLIGDINYEGGATHRFGLGTSLPYSVMKALANNPEDTLIFKCEYKGNRYTFTIHGADVEGKISPEIPWYGPYWLAQNFFSTTVIESLEPVTAAK